MAVLGRLPGSEQELQNAVRAANAIRPQILRGPAANPNRIREALQSNPGIIHFAVHVVSPDRHPEQAALALSIGPDGVPALLTPETIATYRIPGSLVVLSGCSSQQSEVIPAPACWA